MTLPPEAEGVRVRFAPSPTGPLHAGNMRTAVFNWLFAKTRGGKFILRIEDTDTARSRPEFAKEIIDSLEWLGIRADEEPYYQSQRADIYREMTAKLLDAGRVYPCFCTGESLEADRKEAERRGRPPVYYGHCAKLSEAERSDRMARGPFSLRFRVEGDSLTFNDAVRGPVTTNLRLVGDFIVVRSDNTATYNLAAAIDDPLMGISHVIRGEDHISNTPKQLLLMEALGLKPPVYAHLPILLAEDGSKLSKRHANSSFRELIDGGYLPEAVFNFLALLGWHSPDKREDLAPDEIARLFSLDNVAVRASQYNLQKLGWLNRQKIHRMEPERLLALSRPFIRRNAAAFGALDAARQTALVSAARENIARLDEIDHELSPFFGYEPETALAEGLHDYRTREVAKALLDANAEPDFASASAMVARATGEKGKKLYMPLRAAITGRLHGPELKHFYPFFTPEERVRRITAFLEYLG